MYQSSSESSIEHGNFPSVINLYAVGENSSAHQVQAQKTTKTSSASQTYAQTGRTPLDHRGDPFLALAASSSPSSYSRRQFNEDEASYASSPTYAESPTGGCGSSSGSQPAILPAMTSSAISRTSGPKAAPRDRTGSCGSPQSSDSESHSEGDRQQQQRQLSSSSSSTSSEELRPAAFKARIWSAASSGLRKKPPPPPPPPPPPQLQSNIPQRAGMNIVGSPSPSSNSAGSNPGCGTRHSLISQFSSATGRMETVLAETI
uniref:Uncharacterized protein n=1 Tax=Macrostomum lignano TaxID=282301 RepID=A0A1I8H620_9PLAT